MAIIRQKQDKVLWVQKKTVAKAEELYSDKNIKITRTGGNIIIDNLTDKEINIESIFVINNSIEAKPFSSS